MKTIFLIKLSIICLLLSGCSGNHGSSDSIKEIIARMPGRPFEFFPYPSVKVTSNGEQAVVYADDIGYETIYFIVESLGGPVQRIDYCLNPTYAPRAGMFTLNRIVGLIVAYNRSSRDRLALIYSFSDIRDKLATYLTRYAPEYPRMSDQLGDVYVTIVNGGPDCLLIQLTH